MARLDLLLVNPPSRLGVYQHLSRFAAIEPPVWAGLIAQRALNRGDNVEILDAEALGLSHVETAAAIHKKQPRLAAFCIYGHQPSASTQCMQGAISTVRWLKFMQHSEVPTIALGTHPSALPQHTLEDGFDYVCQGEGPYQIDGLLWVLRDKKPKIHYLNDHTACPGVWFPDGLKPRPAALIQNLDEELPRQAWQLLDMKRYRAHHWHLWTGKPDGGYASVQTSLGCPFKCTFCCINAPFGTPGYRTWSAENVVEQIDDLVTNYGITNIKIPDEMFVLNKQHVMRICEALIRGGLNHQLNMWAYARVDTVRDTELLAVMRKAGFRWLGIGVESASKHVRDGIEKGRFGEREIRESIRRVEAAGIHVGANYIFGLPDDTIESMNATLQLACELNTAYANFYCAMAYPGSELHRLAKQKGWALPEDDGPGHWLGYSQHSVDSMPLRTETLTSEQVLDFRDDAFMHYHRRPAYLAKLEREFGPGAVEDVDRIVALGRLIRKHREQEKT